MSRLVVLSVRRKAVLLLATAVIGCGLSVSTGSAQGPVPYYRRSPQLSPWLLLYQNMTGTANYFNFVRPRIALQNFVQDQRNLDQYYDRALSGQQLPTRLGIDAIEAPELGGGIQLRPAKASQGQGRAPSTFMNYDHFFGQSPTISLGGSVGGARQATRPGGGGIGRSGLGMGGLGGRIGR